MATPSPIQTKSVAIWPILLLLGIVTTVSSGCEQKQELLSRWISISVKTNQEESESAGQLTERDFNQLKATLPTLVHAVPKRKSIATATYQGRSHEVQVCVTLGTEMRHLLTDAKTKIQVERFLDDQRDSETAELFVVVSNSLAKTLCGNVSPVDKKIQLGSRELTVIGVLEPPKAALIRLPHQVYLGMNPVQEPVQRKPGELDRIWLEIQTLDQVKTTTDIVRNLLKRNHPDVEFEILSTYPRTTGE